MAIFDEATRRNADGVHVWTYTVGVGKAALYSNRKFDPYDLPAQYHDAIALLLACDYIETVVQRYAASPHKTEFACYAYELEGVGHMDVYPDIKDVDFVIEPEFLKGTGDEIPGLSNR